MSEWSRMTQHLDVHGSDEVLFEEFRLYIFLGHVGFERLQFIEYDFVLFLFGLGFSNALNELFELFGEMTRCRCHYQDLGLYEL